MLELIAESSLLKSAAVIAGKFNMDPVKVAAETNTFKRLFRLAASNHLYKLEAEANKKT